MAPGPGGVLADDSGLLKLTSRKRVQDPAGTGEYVVREYPASLESKQTAIVICDMWNEHWCKGATRRVAEMAPRMHQVVAAARKKGVLIVHAPSGCMEPYKDTPQRTLAQAAPPAKALPKDIAGWCGKLPGEPALPIDDSDGGCDDEPTCPQGSPWKRQIDAIEIAPGDAVTDSGPEFWNLLSQRGVKNVIVMGVHTNMCVSGRPFALRQMAKNGKNVFLARDLTDSMYNSRRSPFVHHRRGTELVIEHIEKHICPTILAADIAGDPPQPHAVFMIGEDEYDTKRTLPAFARSELEPRGVRCTFIHSSEKDPNDFAGLEALRDADLLFLSVRRRTPAREQLAMIREHIEGGKPVVGIRTASHSFDKEPPEGHEAWHHLDTEVLGGHYLGHYGTKPPEGGPSLVKVFSAAAKHSITAGFPQGEVRFASHLYQNRELAKTTAVLLEGRVEGREEREPVAWTNVYKGGRVFYTSLGGPSDFDAPAFRRLIVNAVFWAMERQAREPAAAGGATEAR